MFEHKSVLLNEAIECLAIKPDGIYVDCTLGGGGHSAAILKRLTSGHLYGFDQDEEAIEAARERLSPFSDHFTLISANFRHLQEELAKRGIDQVDGCLYDLGVSSPQFDEEERGFSYRYDGPLDMRMDQRQKLSAYDVVNTYSYNDLTRVLYQYGDEKFAKSIARHIEKERQKKPIETTLELAEIIKQAIPARARRTGGHPAKRSFQAIRIEVNDELNAFQDSLLQAVDLVRVGGRIAVITFQSAEDKIAKHTFNEITSLPDIPKNVAIIPAGMQPNFKKITRKPIKVTETELKNNHRAHSAKLRAVERIKEDEEE